MGGLTIPYSHIAIVLQRKSCSMGVGGTAKSIMRFLVEPVDRI